MVSMTPPEDTTLQTLLARERRRQDQVINLIASENYTSEAVRSVLASELINKYSEGYPGARYYGGNEVADAVEELCQQRARELFGLDEAEWSVNVQPLSGAPANMAVYSAVLGFRDYKKIMGLQLDHGGHLSHGFSASATGKIWQQVPFAVDATAEVLDYDELADLARQQQPDIIVAGFTAYPRSVDFARFRGIADSCGAHLHADIAHIGGLIAGEQHPSPFPHADTVMATTHKTLRGPRSAIIWSRRDERQLPKAIDRAVFPGLQGGPHMNQIAAVAAALYEAQQPDFRDYIAQVVRNAQVLAEELAERGWCIISGGTDTHLLLVDTWAGGDGIGGKEASERLEAKGIIVNKNTVPGDRRTAADPSGIRLGTPAETTRGKTEQDMRSIAERIDAILSV